MEAFLLPAFLFCLGLSFLLSGMEAGVFALSRLRIRQRARAGVPQARALHEYLENPERFLWTILVGNTAANVVIVTIGVWWLRVWLGTQPFLLAAALAAGVLVFYAGFELLPKMLFRLYPNRLTMALAAPFRLIDLALRPLVAPVTLLARGLQRWTGGARFTGHLFGNREELRQVMQDSAQGLSSEERAMINRVLDLQHLRVQSVMTPMDHAATVAAETPLREALALGRERGFSRLPVWRTEGGRRRVAGVVALDALLFDEQLDPSRPAGAFVAPALYLDEEARLEVALRQMQRTGQRLAIVLGREGRETGVVGVGDVLAVIFGKVEL
jgi:CBS domain containing-hemolysin-like protein